MHRPLQLLLCQTTKGEFFWQSIQPTTVVSNMSTFAIILFVNTSSQNASTSCTSPQMIADILTKPLGRIKFEYFREGLGVGDRND